MIQLSKSKECKCDEKHSFKIIGTNDKLQEYKYDYTDISCDIDETEFLFEIEAKSEWSPYGILENNVDGYKELIVPNIVHYLLLDYNDINFAHYLSFKSVLNIQKPEKIMIHSNYNKLEGKYWMKLKDEYKDLNNIVIMKKIEVREKVFGVKFSNIWHNSDIIRNKVCK